MSSDLLSVIQPVITLSLLAAGVFVIWWLCRLSMASHETATKRGEQQSKRFMGMLSEIRDRIERRNDQ
jgi:large-conductance mechanosensitive channel